SRRPRRRGCTGGGDASTPGSSSTTGEARFPMRSPRRSPAQTPAQTPAHGRDRRPSGSAAADLATMRRRVSQAAGTRVRRSCAGPHRTSHGTRRRPVTEAAAERLVYLGGDLVEESRATVSVFDRGFLWGDGVYEVTPSFDGVPFRLGAHLD